MTAQAVITGSFQALSNDYGITGQSVVAIPPSTDDPNDELMRVVVDGIEITRAYDPALEGTVYVPPVLGDTWATVTGTWNAQTDTWGSI